QLIRLHSRRNIFIFFFSSRRRHTRWPRDWSSDVCSSDLAKDWEPFAISLLAKLLGGSDAARLHQVLVRERRVATSVGADYEMVRSEERRVGKEWRCRRLA